MRNPSPLDEGDEGGGLRGEGEVPAGQEQVNKSFSK